MAKQENQVQRYTFCAIDEFGAEIHMPRRILEQSYIVSVRLASGWIYRMNSRHIKDLPKEDPVTLIAVMDVLIDHTELYDPCLKQK
jgi:hypothetical protein